MKKLTVAITAAIVLLLGTGAVYATNQHSEPPKQPVITAHVYTAEELLIEANKLRAEKGVAPLKLDERLSRSSQCWANEMQRLKFFGHDYPDGADREKCVKDAVAFSCSKVSENLNWGDVGHSPFDEKGWPSSKAHYDALINSRYDLTGFGYVEFDNKSYFVQHFCDLK